MGISSDKQIEQWDKLRAKQQRHKDRKRGLNYAIRWGYAKARVVEQPTRAEHYILMEINLRKGSEAIQVPIRVCRSQADNKVAEEAQIAYLDYLYRERMPTAKLDSSIQKVFRKLPNGNWPTEIQVNRLIVKLLNCPKRKDDQKISLAPIHFAVEPISEDTKTKECSPEQEKFVKDLLKDRFVPSNCKPEVKKALDKMKYGDKLTNIEAHRMIKMLHRCDFKPY